MDYTYDLREKSRIKRNPSKIHIFTFQNIMHLFLLYQNYTYFSCDMSAKNSFFFIGAFPKLFSSFPSELQILSDE